MRDYPRDDPPPRQHGGEIDDEEQPAPPEGEPPVPEGDEPPAPPAGPVPPKRPRMPRPGLPVIPPPTTATPVSQGSFARPGMTTGTMAAFRTPQFNIGGIHGVVKPSFGPGTPMAGGALAPADLSNALAGGTGEGPMTPDELLKMLLAKKQGMV